MVTVCMLLLSLLRPTTCQNTTEVSLSTIHSLPNRAALSVKEAFKRSSLGISAVTADFQCALLISGRSN